jgi:hypothetical protein
MKRSGIKCQLSSALAKISFIASSCIYRAVIRIIILLLSLQNEVPSRTNRCSYNLG